MLGSLASRRMRPIWGWYTSSPSPSVGAPSPLQRKELDDALARIAELERRVGAAGKRDTELQALRTQLRETTEQLDRAQIDAGTLRDRLALTQRALEEEIQHGGADEVSIRRPGGRTGSQTTRSTHG